jgi:hypothetical protein
MDLSASVSGLFKWRQFEPEVILLAVGWSAFFLVDESAQVITDRRAELRLTAGAAQKYNHHPFHLKSVGTS